MPALTCSGATEAIFLHASPANCVIREEIARSLRKRPLALQGSLVCPAQG